MTSSIETIVACATAPGRGGVAIVRVSGPLVKTISEKILNTLPQPRVAIFSPFFDSSREMIDEGLALYFSAPHSFTGEDVLELHCHGGTAVVDCLIQTVLSHGARMARPGEFSERAYLNDKIDLAQAEAVADLINASSEQAVRASVRTLQGVFSKKINELVEALIHLRMYIEAAIDFVEEEIDFLKDEKIVSALKKIISNLVEVQSSATQGSILREGITIVIAGEPNVGKSTLLNQLCGKETAIVTDIPGTTRDVLRETILMDGIPLHVIDTAGLRESDDVVEQEGIRRAKEEIKNADILLYLFSIDTVIPPQGEIYPLDIKNQSPCLDAVIPAQAGIHSANNKIAAICINNKIDLTNQSPSLHTKDNQTYISLSAKTGAGIDLLKNHIKSLIGFQDNTEGVFSARRRHIDALANAHLFLNNALNQLTEKKAGELAAEDLRQAQKSLSEITGEFTTDDLLGRIFSSFCIGK